MFTELEAILTGTRAFPRQRAPEPLLLPRIASRIAVERLDLVCRTASELSVRTVGGARWPVIDATAEVIGARRGEIGDGLLADLTGALPGLPALLRGERGPEPEEAYLRELLDRLDELDPDLRWVLFGSLLPELDAATIERLLARPPSSGWLATVAASRAAGRLSPSRIVAVERSLRRVDPPWSRQARDLLAAAGPAASAFDEVTRALPYDRRLAELLAADPDQALLTDTLWHMLEEWGGEAPPPRLKGGKSPMLGIDEESYRGRIGFGRRREEERREESAEAAARGFRRRARWESAEEAAEPPPPAAERYLQADVHVDLGGPPTETRHSFVAGETHRVRFWIGPPGEGIAADIPVAEPEPDEEEKRTGAIEIRVVFEHDGTFQDDTVALPIDRGRASAPTREFRIEVGAGQETVTADVWLVHKGRVVQNLEFGGPVSAGLLPGKPDHPRRGIRISERIVVRPLPDTPDATEYGASVVHRGGKLLRFGPGGTAEYSLGDSDEVVKKINDKLDLLARALVRASQDGAGVGWVEEDDDEVLALLRYVAAQGNQLYARLVDLGLGEVPDPIQLVNVDPDDVVPLEYVYDKGLPKEGAKLCKGWREALLEGGECGCDNRPGEVAETICPLGFWALSRRIERQEARPVEPGEAAPRYSAAGTGGGTLHALTSAVFANSRKVKELDVETMRAKLGACFPGRHTVVEGWGAWCEAVEAGPDLLLLLPHQGEDHDIDTRFLEISTAEGKEDRLYAGNVKPKHVNHDEREPGPIVLLLGCKTAEAGLLSFNTFARAFQAKRASIVVATLAKVLGRHATPVATAFIDELIAASASGESFATVLRTVRRRMFAAGYLIALCVIAYGDGEWKLAPPPAAGAGGDDVPA